MDTTAPTTARVKTVDGAAIEETDLLIASDKVEGTSVYNRQDEHLGSVHNFMVDKSTGQVAYAVMSFGGFLGMGESYHPLPWRVLKYETSMGGYVVDVDRRQLEKAPSYTRANEPDWTTYPASIDAYYAIPSV